MAEPTLISIIVPVYNEAGNLSNFFASLSDVLRGLNGYQWELIFVNDGSSDGSGKELDKISGANKSVDPDGRLTIKILEFSRNFGKEAALTAGLNAASGAAALMIDADFQHPLELIPRFIDKWAMGAEVVIGVRSKNNKAGWIKRAGSFLFYCIIRRISRLDMRPKETDFRILDRQVIDAFKALPEKNRMTRALIDWLGFRREYLEFAANERADGHAGYSLGKLIHLAMNSFVSLSLLPLKLAGYLGLFIIFTDGPFGFYIFLGKYVFDWSYAESFSGPAQLALLITFLVGIVLTSLGLVALYIAHIHNEVLGRPLYIIRKKI
ncbi:MAG: glycosyltransferase family 2 protein [Patescibacteria group bacterium]